MASKEVGLKFMLMRCVEDELLPLSLAQLLWLSASEEMYVSLVEEEAADRFIGPPLLRELVDPSAHEPLSEGLSFRLRSVRRDEAEQAFDASIGRGIWPGDAEQATATTGHVVLGSEDTKDVTSGDDVLSGVSEEERRRITAEVTEEALLGVGITSEGLLSFDGEAQTGATSVDDVVDKGNPLSGLDAEGGTEAVDGGRGSGVERSTLGALLDCAPAD